MAAWAPDETLLDISKARKADLTAWGRGIYLTTSTGRTLPELSQRASADRIALASRFLKSGRTLVAVPGGEYRSAISRFYYSMYHAARSVAFHHHGGDDHQEHSEVPQHLPGDFPNREIWVNALKGARLARNRADYDPYPKNDNRWETEATAIGTTAEDFLRLCRAHLRAKGCAFV